MNIYLMRGIPGAGKTTWIKKNLPENRVVVSADHYFMHDGQYIFDPTKLHDAHQHCFLRFFNEITKLFRTANLIVDNTNIELLDIAPYVAIAQVYDFDVTIVEFRIDPGIAIARNIHGVPANKIISMANRMNTIRLPLGRWPNVRIVDFNEYNNKLQS